MATRKQIAANRRNAKKSTGPKSPEGKARSAQNALRHGLLSRTPVLPDEDGAQYETLRVELYLELRPLTELEKLIVNRIAAVQWRLARIPGLEAELFERLRYDALGHDDGLGTAWVRDAEPYGGALARLSRYETALERSSARLLEELRRLQRDRRREEQQYLRPDAQAPQGPWWERMDAAWPGAPSGASPRPTDGGLQNALPPGWPGPTPEERAADRAMMEAHRARNGLRNEADPPDSPRGNGSGRAPAEGERPRR